MDRISVTARSALMARVKQKDTAPEIRVRKILHRHGFRFRLHRRDLPGSPDIVLPKFKTVLFVHGCFWHRHENCSRASTPVANDERWATKFERNVARDKEALERLAGLGWRALVVWECETKTDKILEERLRSWFDFPGDRK